MRVLLTGATGFIGKAIAAELEDGEFDVIPVGGPLSLMLSVGSPSVTCDVSSRESVMNLASIGKVDAVVHAAGLAHRFHLGNSFDFASVNIEGVRNVAELAVKMGAAHLVLLSSVLVYGDAGNNPSAEITEDFPCVPKGIYGKSKLGGENAAREVCEQNSLSLTILRLVPTIGEASKGNFAKLVRAIDRRMFVWVGRGENRKSMIYVRDVARAVKSVLVYKGAAVEIFNLAAPASSMKNIVEEVARTTGRRIPRFVIPQAPLLKLLRSMVRLALSKRLAVISDTLEKWCSDEVYSAQKIECCYGFKTSTTVLEAVRLDVNAYLQNVGSRTNN